MPDDKQYKTLAFISGTEVEQEKQKSEIRQYCCQKGFTTPAEDEFISDWQTLKDRLQHEAYRVVVITNLKIMSDELDESINRVHYLLKNSIRVEVINESQHDMLESGQPENLGFDKLELFWERFCDDLKKTIS